MGCVSIGLRVDVQRQLANCVADHIIDGWSVGQALVRPLPTGRDADDVVEHPAQPDVGDHAGRRRILDLGVGDDADRKAAAKGIAALSRFIADFADQVQEVEINPFAVFAEGKGCLALDCVRSPLEAPLLAPAAPRSNEPERGNERKRSRLDFERPKCSMSIRMPAFGLLTARTTFSAASRLPVSVQCGNSRLTKIPRGFARSHSRANRSVARLRSGSGSWAMMFFAPRSLICCWAW